VKPPEAHHRDARTTTRSSVTDTTPSVPDLAMLARPSGGFAMLALDQREAMRAMFADEGLSPVRDSLVTDFKLTAGRILGPHASAVLVDRQFALDQFIDEQTVGPDTGLIAAADHFIPSADELVADSVIDPAVDPAHYRERGVTALKLLVIYRPDTDPDARKQTVDDFIARCRAAGLISIIEPVSRAPRGGGSWDWNRGVHACAEELGDRGADLYKAEVPLRGKGHERRLRDECARLHDAIASPWVVLSSGVADSEFPRAVGIACTAGASGFLAGRAVWRSCIGADDYGHALRTVAVPRLQHLRDVVDEAMALRS
jgi:sulfofructosephosphate aldolase